ncbi:hypothetical protein ACP70R_004031 [Stipagrostis hirtigluma subsp. patula]
MNLLRRFGLDCLDRLSHFRCRSSIGPKSIDVAPRCAPAGSPAASAKKDPSWLMLNYGIARWNDSAVADAKTAAESRTSTGQLLRVSLGLAAPPDSVTHGYVVAAHCDAVLLNVDHKLGGSSNFTDDSFVYKTSAAKPPSLSLLPYPAGKLQLDSRNTGLLRRGEDELLVVKLFLELGYRTDTATMWMHRLGSHEWEKKQVPIVVAEEVDYHSGLVVCDMAEESLKLRYVELPMIPEDDFGCGPNNRDTWDMCAVGDSAVRFVSIDPRCCCGHSPSTSASPNSDELFVVTTWTLALTMEKPMVWVKENKLDCEELWALPGYEGLPRTLVEFPVLSSADPDVVCFIVREDGEDWKVEVDTRNKVVLSTAHWTDVPKEAWYVHVSAKLPWLTREIPGGTKS